MACRVVRGRSRVSGELEPGLDQRVAELLQDARRRGAQGRDAIAAIVRHQPDAIVRAYSRVRFLILRQSFLDAIGQYFPERGDILDLGCGFGLFSLYYAIMGPERRITGVDLDARRIEMARRCAASLGVTNARYHAEDVLQWRDDRTFDAIYMLDLVHHLPVATVPGTLERIAARLAPGGTLVIKDVADKPTYKMLFTLALDRLMVGMDPIRYWPVLELSSLLRALGFEVRVHPIRDVLPYPHVLYVCRRSGR
jgi:2-polyprenyl-3-methyl-5-hydroxy-6-metoxy-1,4-benzoquinol methylase